MLFQNVKIRETDAKDKSIVWKPAFSKIIFCLSVLIFSTILTACRAPKVDLRGLAPADAIVYLETNDLGRALKSLTENQAFREIAEQTTDFSPLENVRLAIAVTGFETSESQVTDENAVLNFSPRFVAVAETHGWQWQTVSLVENQLNDFVRRNYGAETRLEKSDKADGKFFIWSAKDGRKVYAFVKGGRIYFGNDAAAIEKCAVTNGANEDSANNRISARAAVANSPNALAFGYVSSEGIKQIADFAGVSVAVAAAEETEAKSFIAGILPPILRNTTEEIAWTANKTAGGIEDNYEIILKPEVAAVTRETLTTAVSPSNSVDLLPAEFFSATRYNLKNPLIAWRSSLFLTAKNTDALSGKLLINFSGALLEPYGIRDAEKFLSSIDSEIITIQFDESGEESAAIVTVKNPEDLKKSIVRELDFRLPPTADFNAAIWFSESRQFAAAFVENKFIIGAEDSVLKCLRAKQSGENFTKNSVFPRFAESRHVAVTLASDADSVNQIVETLATKRKENRQSAAFYTTETRFTEKGFERKTISDFGLIGTILKQLNR